jgi:hypothetical protein
MSGTTTTVYTKEMAGKVRDPAVELDIRLPMKQITCTYSNSIHNKLFRQLLKRKQDNLAE